MVKGLRGHVLLLAADPAAFEPEQGRPGSFLPSRVNRASHSGEGHVEHAKLRQRRPTSRPRPRQCGSGRNRSGR